MRALNKYSILVFLLFSALILHAQAEFNKLDEKGNKHGLWKGVYEGSKRPRYEGTFNHGKEIGIFNFFDDTKAQSIIATRNFNTNDNSAYTIFYDQKKNKVSEGKVVNKAYEGEWKYYHRNSKVIMTLENYKSGKLDGIRSVFYLNSKIAEETPYKNGIKEGAYKKYSEKGIVLESVSYKNGEYDGEAVYKDSDDSIVSKGKFSNGKKVGIWQFFQNGKLTSEDNFNTPRKRIKFKND